MAQPVEVTWEYITTGVQLLEVRKTLLQYLAQGTGDEKPLLCVDFETRRKFPKGAWSTGAPRSIWVGKYFDGYPRLLAIGLDTDNQYKIRDKQFIIDVMLIGAKKVLACLKDILESTVLIAHKGAYEWQYFTTMGFENLRILDTMHISQILNAGNQVRHDLFNCYKRYLIGKGIFFQYTNMGFAEYASHKKSMQLSNWNASELSHKQKQYSADDVRMPFPLLECMYEVIDQHVYRYEQHLREDQGIIEVINLEIGCLPCFADMEQQGIGFDIDKYENEVKPLMMRKIVESRKRLMKYSELLPKRAPGEKHLVFTVTGNDIDDIVVTSITTKNGVFDQKSCKLSLTLRSLRKSFREEFGNDVGLKVTQKKFVNRRELRMVWTSSDPRLSRRRLKEWLEKQVDHRPTFIYKPEFTIDFKKRKEVMEAFSKIIGESVTSLDEYYLFCLLDKVNPKRTQVISEYLEFQQASEYFAKYGTNGLRRFVTPAGRIHGQLLQMGSDFSEIATGRTGGSEPYLLNITDKETLYDWGYGEPGINSGELIRQLFIPTDPDCEFVNADLSQIEVVLLAAKSKDKLLNKILNEDGDMHRIMAAKYLNKNIEDVTDFERNCCGKPSDLGKLYGMMHRTNRKNIIKFTKGKFAPTEDEAKKYDRDFSDAFPGIVATMDRSGAKAFKSAEKAGSLVRWRHLDEFGNRIPFGVIQDALGRPRFFYVPRSFGAGKLARKMKDVPDKELRRDYAPDDFEGNPNYYYNYFKQVRNKCRLTAHNMTIQGTGAEVLKYAMLLVWEGIGKLGLDRTKNRIVLECHDELLVQFEKKNLEAGIHLVYTSMMSAARRFADNVPVKLNISHGDSWYSASPKKGHQLNMEAWMKEYEKKHPKKRKKQT